MFFNAWLRFLLFVQSLGLAGSTINQRTRCRASVGLLLRELGLFGFRLGGGQLGPLPPREPGFCIRGKPGRGWGSMGGKPGITR